MYNTELDENFLAEALWAAVIIRNISPAVAVDNMTPYESFSGRKTDVYNFKVIGCKAFMYLPKKPERYGTRKPSISTYDSTIDFLIRLSENYVYREMFYVVNLYKERKIQKW